MSKIIIYTDGASRGNPGPSAIGVVISGANGQVLKEYSKTISEGTNNEAEYQAVIFALKKVKTLFGKQKVKNCEIEVKADSELVVSQLTGKYRIKEPRIQELFIQAWNLMVDFGRLDFKFIPREQNKRADQLANQALDRDKMNGRLL